MSVLKTSLKQIRRRPYQALAAIMVMFLAFFAVTCFALISLGSFKVLQYFEAAPQVIAFFEKGKDLSSEEINTIRAKLETTGQLADFKYVSTREAEAIYREKNKDDPLLLELVNYKILPPSIEISAKSINALSKLKQVLETHPGVEDIAFYEDIVASLSSWIKNIRLFGLAIIGYLLVQSVLIIITLIGLKILVKKEEIEILRLIGASNWFIRWPFLLEGMFYGVAGGFLGWGAAYLLLLYSTPLILNWFADINLVPVPLILMLVLLAGNLVVGMIMGMLASLLAVHRFLRK
jgi:cell division transport system permease protein